MGGAPVDVHLLAHQLENRLPGGTGRYTLELARALAAATPPGSSLDLVAGRGRGPLGDAEVATIPVSRSALPTPVLARLWERGLPPRPARGGVVHAPTLLLPPAASSSRLVVTVHDVVPWSHPDTLTPRGVAFHRRMGSRAAQDADILVTPTEVVAAQVRDLLHPRAPVVAVHSGVAVREPPHDGAARRARLGAQAAYVLFVGTAEPRKGLDVLVAALARPELDGLTLVVAGPPGWGEVDVGALAAAHGVAGRIVVTGRVDEDDLTALYTGAAVLAMPSRREGFGFPVVEAMALGVPVVVSDDPALLEVAGGAALVAPVGDVGGLAAQLARAAGDERAAMMSGGLQRAARFTWEATAQRMWEVYESLEAR